jgi:transcription elongation factor Elf1
MFMIHSIAIDFRILFRKFYCPICGQKLKVVMEVNKLTDKQKERYYQELYPYGVPINIDVGKTKQMFKCNYCNYYNTTDNQLLINKKQKHLKLHLLVRIKGMLLRCWLLRMALQPLMRKHTPERAMLHLKLKTALIQ